MDIDSFDATHREARTNGIRMHYVEKGEGPLVVLLHGFPEHWWSWRYQIGPLAAAGFRVVAPDLRGYNETERRGPYDLDTLCADVRGLIGALGAKRAAAVVGHDWGGAIAWHLASTDEPPCERLAVLNAPHPAVFLRSLSGGTQLRRSWYMGLFQLPWLPEQLLSRRGGEVVERAIRAASADRRAASAAELRPFRDAAQEPGAARAMLAYYRTSGRQAFARPRSFQRYGRITVPTRVIWGMRDPALGFDEQVPGLSRYVERLEVERVEGAGHFVQSEKPDAVNARLIEFLRG